MTNRSFPPHISLCLLLACFIDARYVCAVEYEARIWADKSGKFEIRATYIDVIDGKVRLERPNGTITRVPIKKLSEADQKYIRELDKQPQSKKPVVQGLQVGDRIEAKHFDKWRAAIVVEIDYKWEKVEVSLVGESDFSWPKSLDELRYPKTMQQPVLIKPSALESTLKTVRPDYEDMESLLFDGKPADHVEADQLKPLEGSWKPRTVRLVARGDHERLSFFQKAADFAISASPTPLAVIVYGTKGMDENPALIDLVDLARRKVVLRAPAPLGTGMLAISPHGGSLATFRTDYFGNEGTGLIDFWKIADKKISHQISFAPYVMNAWPGLDPKWSAWLDDERLFTLNSEGQLILWQVEGAKAIYELEIDGNIRPIFTHGRKYLVVPTSSGVQFIDPQSGDLKAVIGFGDYRHSSLAFSPSGKQLAIISYGFIDVFDVTSGEATRSFPCEKINSGSVADWIDEEYLLTSNGVIIHVPLRLIAWKYELPGQMIKSFAGTHWALLRNNSNEEQVLTPLELPPPEAVTAIESLDKDNLLVVKPGDTIRIDVQIHNDNFLAQDVKQALTEALAEAGMNLSDESDLKLVAKAKTGKTDKVRYHRFGAFHDPGEMIEVTSRVYELELQLQGVVVWQRKSIHSAPMHLRMEKGETIRAAIDRVLKPGAGNFRGRLPSYVVRPEHREPLGKSKLSL